MKYIVQLLFFILRIIALSITYIVYVILRLLWDFNYKKIVHPREWEDKLFELTP